MFANTPLRLTPEQSQWVTDNRALAYDAANRVARCMLRKLPHWSHRGLYFWQFVDEVQDAALIGFCQGVMRYDPDRGAKMSSYAYNCAYYYALGASCQTLIKSPNRKWRRYVSMFSDIERLTTARQDDQTDFDVCDAADHTDHSVKPELTALLHLFLHRRDYRVVELRIFEGLTLEEIGKDIGVTKERVRQILMRALRRLQNNLVFRRVLESQAERARQLRRHDFLDGSLGWPI